jgi:helix-turn-helix protein
MSSIASASARVGNLVMRAMVFFESDREVAWRCLRDASTLLGGETETIDIDTPRWQSILPPGGRQSFGSTPMAYVAARRVEHAKLMMTFTRQRLTDVALTCGFSDQSHLTRAFRRLVGISPARWRRLSLRNSQALSYVDGGGAKGEVAVATI